MWGQSALVLVMGALLFLLEEGLSLKCFRCSSPNDKNCEDPFNSTKILNLPDVSMRSFHYHECAGLNSATTLAHMKNVCLKVVVVDKNNEKSEITRECRMVSRNHKSGTCPEDIPKSTKIQYCGTCDHDACNSAPRIKLILTGVVPIVLMVLLYF